jgi:hypothetical protein
MDIITELQANNIAVSRKLENTEDFPHSLRSLRTLQMPRNYTIPSRHLTIIDTFVLEYILQHGQAIPTSSNSL